MKKFLFPLWVLCLVVLFGCATSDLPDLEPDTSIIQDTSDTPVTIPFQLPVYPDFSLHPAYTENRTNRVIGALLYEPLFTLNEQFEAQPVLCKSYTISEDGRIWTLTLQPNVTFSNGIPLSGTVVADALNLLRTEPSLYAQRLVQIQSISGEENHVIITLSEPNYALDHLLDIPIALGSDETPVGTGCYILSKSEDNWALVARQDWWQQTSVPAKTIPLTSVSKSDDLVFSFDSGDISLVDVDLMGTNSLGYSGSYETWDYSTTAMLYLGYNTRSGNCTSSEVRQAISRCIDRDSIAQVDFSRHAVASALPVHPASPLYDSDIAATLAYSPSVAQEATPSLTFLVNSENAARVAVANRITEQLMSAGWNVTLSVLSFEDYTAALERGRFDLYLAEVVLRADFDLSSLLMPNATLNYGRWNNTTTQNLLSTLRATPQSERTAAAQALYTHLAEQVPIAPICFKNGSILTRWGLLSGLNPVRSNPFYMLERWSIHTTNENIMKWRN